MSWPFMYSLKHLTVYRRELFSFATPQALQSRDRQPYAREHLGALGNIE
jgi:hypothetical protein